jgi:stage II sporulation SpoAA-like protein
MGSIKQEEHVTGVVIIRATGRLTSDDIEDWRDELEEFVKASKNRGACGALVDVSYVEEFSIDALDSVLEFLADPEEVISGVRMRFALIGVKPFTQRFLREAMPLDELKHIRARFFHEVAEDEALAWLQAMVTSATDLPEVKPSEKSDSGDREKKSQRDPKAAILNLVRPAEPKPVAEAISKKAAEVKTTDNPNDVKKPTPILNQHKDGAKKK